MDILDAAIYSEAKLAVAYATPTIPSRLALIDLTSGEVTDLYDPNQAVMSQLTISKPETFWYEGADGWQIQGWYLPRPKQRRIIQRFCTFMAVRRSVMGKHFSMRCKSMPLMAMGSSC